MIPDFLTVRTLVWTKEDCSDAQYVTVKAIEPDSPEQGQTTIRYDAGDWWYTVLDTDTGLLLDGVEVAPVPESYFRQEKIARLVSMLFNQSDEVIDAMLVLAKETK